MNSDPNFFLILTEEAFDLLSAMFRPLRRFYFLIAIAFLFLSPSLKALENPLPLFSVGGGLWDAGEKYSGGLFQAEYKFGTYLWHHLRPQATAITQQCHSLFLGLGLGWEFYVTNQIILTPSFTPGYYYSGSGRNLGFPLEFRSSLELAYEFEKKARIGVQAYHISNAHLSHRNPGGNSLTFFIAFPVNYFKF